MNTTIEDAEGEGWPIHKRTNFVEGPKGFTESLDDHTVELLVRMGLVEWQRTMLEYGWQVKVYRAPGMTK